MASAILSGNEAYLTFLCFSDLSGGFLYTTPAPELEELRTPGVDGKRHRTMSYQFGPIQAQTIQEATNYTAAIALGNQYRSVVGQFMLLTISVGTGQNL